MVKWRKFERQSKNKSDLNLEVLDQLRTKDELTRDIGKKTWSWECKMSNQCTERFGIAQSQSYYKLTIPLTD